jgi:hypothetical protein
MALETPGRVRYLEKYVCPLCGKRRWWSEQAKKRGSEGESASFFGFWMCEGQCIGMTMSYQPPPMIMWKFSLVRRSEDSCEQPTS